MNTLSMLAAVLGMGGLFVFLPMASRYRHKNVVTCPEADQPAEILVDARVPSLSGTKKKALTVRNCSLWPKRRGCTQSCVRGTTSPLS